MSWIGGYKSKTTEADSREAKRKKLEADRLKRAQERSNRQQQLLALQPKINSSKYGKIVSVFKKPSMILNNF